jgi:hypothetical protein
MYVECHVQTAAAAQLKRSKQSSRFAFWKYAVSEEIRRPAGGGGPRKVVSFRRRRSFGTPEERRHYVPWYTVYIAMHGKLRES